MQLERGRIKSVRVTKGHGRIGNDAGEVFWFHRSSLVNCALFESCLKPGDFVEFVAERNVPGPNGLRHTAHEIEVIHQPQVDE
jgi:hypothetical protein